MIIFHLSFSICHLLFPARRWQLTAENDKWQMTNGK